MARDKRELNKLAEKAAIINVYAIINPLKTLFNTGIIENMDRFRSKNEAAKDQNGEKMYDYIKSFIEDFSKCDVQTQKRVLVLYKKYHEIEMEKYIEIIRMTTGRDLSYGCAYNQCKDEEGNILIEAENWHGEKKKVVVFP